MYNIIANVFSCFVQYIKTSYVNIYPLTFHNTFGAVAQAHHEVWQWQSWRFSWAIGNPMHSWHIFANSPLDLCLVYKKICCQMLQTNIQFTESILDTIKNKPSAWSWCWDLSEVCTGMRTSRLNIRRQSEHSFKNALKVQKKLNCIQCRQQQWLKWVLFHAFVDVFL